MIALENLSVVSGTFRLDNIRLVIPTGGYAVLMGKTGSGKTTLLEAICGLKTIRTGTICLLGHDMTRRKPAERGVGYVPQDRALFPTMTVWDHLALALAVRRWDRRRIAERVGELADLLGLGHLLDRRPQGLSGGEAQRVALGRALSAHPSVLLLDEPLSALDEATRHEMHELLAMVRRRTGVTTLHVTHSEAEAAKLADRLLLLKNGVIEDVALDSRSNGAAALPATEVRP